MSGLNDLINDLKTASKQTASVTSNSLKNRRGRFQVNEELVKQNPELFEELFVYMKFVPTYVASTPYGNGERSYSGFSHLFEELADDEKIPSYRIDITKSSQGKHTFNIRRVK